MADRRVHVNLVAIVSEIVEIEHGVWCDRCLLPAAARIIVATTKSTGEAHLSTLVRCYECP